MASHGILILAFVVGMTGCFFAQPINGEPRAVLDKDTTGLHYRFDTLRFSASKSSDPDGDVILADWKAFTCNLDRTACDTPSIASAAGEPIDSEFRFTIPAFRNGSGEATEMILVTLTVRDPHGAEHLNRMFVEVLNRNPVLDMHVQGHVAAGGGYPIGTSMQIVASGSDPEGDEVSYQWRLYPASGSMPEQVRWQQLSTTVYELEPDRKGLWQVEVTATDGVGGETAMTVPILVQEDALPCISLTDPLAEENARYIVDRSDEPRRFSVLSVADDLDVYPLPLLAEPPWDRAQFRWLVATPNTNDNWVELSDHDMPDYVVDASLYVPGDRLRVRVEIDDRMQREIVCGIEQATCSLGGNECLQRVTWEVEVR